MKFIDMEQAKLVYLGLDDVEEDPDQPRGCIWDGDDKDQQLLESVREHGMLSPLHVSTVRGRTRIIDGHRRFRAAKLLGFTEVPCYHLGNIPAGGREVIRFKLNGIKW